MILMRTSGPGALSIGINVERIDAGQRIEETRFAPDESNERLRFLRGRYDQWQKGGPNDADLFRRIHPKRVRIDPLPSRTIERFASPIEIPSPEFPHRDKLQ
jgi:hypothetical protein